jgi:hypothetical protein
MKLRADLTGTAEVRAMLQKLGRPMAAQALAATAEDARDYAKGEADRHTKTGAMAASTYLKRDGAGWEVGHDMQRAPHALFVHWGAKPHKIRPKVGGGKKSLRWPAGGAWGFAKVVHHPGYKGDPWLVRAAAQAPLDFARHVAERVRQITKD